MPLDGVRFKGAVNSSKSRWPRALTRLGTFSPGTLCLPAGRPCHVGRTKTLCRRVQSLHLSNLLEAFPQIIGSSCLPETPRLSCEVLRGARGSSRHTCNAVAVPNRFLQQCRGLFPYFLRPLAKRSRISVLRNKTNTPESRRKALIAFTHGRF